MTIPTNPSLNEEWTNDATGVTYKWDGERWYIVSSSDAELEENYVTKVAFQTDQERQDEEIAVLDSLIKGVSYLYIIDNTTGTAVPRAGQISSNTGFYSNINKFSFGTADASGTTTPLMSNGDIIEIYNAEENKTNRYKITDASGAPTLVNVEYISGNYFLAADATLSVQVYPDSNVATLEARVAVGETLQNVIQTEQGTQNNQINALETQVQLLAGVKAVGRWTYRRRIDGSSVRPPSLKTFYGTNVLDVSTVLTSWEDTNLLMISKTDLDDTTFTFSDFEEGDKVEIIAIDGSSAVYGTVTNNPNIDSYGNFAIDVERWRGGPVEEAEYLISAYRPGSSSSNVDLDILDQRYLVKTGDTMNGPLTVRGSELFEKDDSTKQFKLSPNTSDYFTNIYAYNGGGMRFRVAPGNTDADYKTAISAAYSSHTVDGATHPVETAVNWLRNPTQPHHAANKAYVDANAGGVGTALHPPGLKFKYQEGSGTASSGNFKWYQSGGRRLNISATSQDFDWGTLLPRVDINYAEGHAFTIWLMSNGVWKMKTTGTITRLDLHSDHILCYVSYNTDLNGSLVAGSDHYITIAGMF